MAQSNIKDIKIEYDCMDDSYNCQVVYGTKIINMKIPTYDLMNVGEKMYPDWFLKEIVGDYNHRYRNNLLHGYENLVVNTTPTYSSSSVVMADQSKITPVENRDWEEKREEVQIQVETEKVEIEEKDFGDLKLDPIFKEW